MVQPAGDPPGKGVDKGIERQRWIGRIANQITDTMLGDDVAGLDLRIGRLAEAFAPALGLPKRAVLAAAESARERLTQLAGALGLQVSADDPASRLMAGPRDLPADTLAPHRLAATAPAPLDDGLTIVLDHPTEAAPRGGPPPAELLAAGVQDITNSMVADNSKLNEVLRMVLETMYRALDFRRIMFCLRDPKTETLTGRFGLGSDVDVMKAAFRVPLRPKGAPDLFSAICTKGMDTLIADATSGAVGQRLPAWYREKVNAPTFLLLPMALKGSTFALIYADKARAGGIVLDEKELSLLRTLRNQAVMAFRQLG
jgi:hypothetical protein